MQATSSIGAHPSPTQATRMPANRPAPHNIQRCEAWLRPERMVRRWLAGPPLQVLQQRASKPNALQAMWQERHEAYRAHTDNLGLKALARWGAGEMIDALLAPRRRLTHAMLPIATMEFHNLMGLHEDFRADAPSRDLTLTAAHTITHDHVLLDAMWVRVRRPQGPTWPVIVFVPPNGMIYEELIPPACNMAQLCQVDVLLFNYRGIGKSMGRLNAIGDAVTDTATCIVMARAQCPQVGVLGLSMGGGTAAAALAQAHRAAPNLGPPVDLFLAVHTFSSWSDVAAGRQGRAYATAFFSLAALLGMGRLPTLSTLARWPLARTTWALEASDERVIAASARLGNPDRARVGFETFVNVGRRHGDLSFLAPKPPKDLTEDEARVREQLMSWRAAMALSPEPILALEGAVRP